MKKEIQFTPDLFLPAEDNFKDAEKIERPSISYWSDVWRRLKQNKLAMTGLAVIIILILFAVFGPYINKYAYDKPDWNEKNLWPDPKSWFGTKFRDIHWFGTDTLGRDIFTRAWHGARISLFIGFMAAITDFAIGVLYGGIAGIKGGKVDNIMMRIADILYSLPYMLMVILIMVVMGSGLWTMVFAMTITGWIPMARLVRGQVLQLKEQEYVQASRALGANTTWILIKHIIPNTMGPILVNLTLSVPSAIFSEATLSFLGLGISAPKASWGTMASDALASILVGNSYQLFIPAILISITMLAFNIFGDGLRDALDPKLRK